MGLVAPDNPAGYVKSTPFESYKNLCSYPTGHIPIYATTTLHLALSCLNGLGVLNPKA